MTSYKTSPYYLFILFLYFNTHQTLAQKKENPNAVLLPSREITKSDSPYFVRAKQQSEAEANDYDFKYETNHGIQNLRDTVSFLSRSKRVGLHFISKDNLLDLLYNTQVDKEKQNFGFWILFSKNKSELALVRKGETTSQKYLLIRPTAKVGQNSILAKPILSSLRQNFPYKIKGYFIGRRLLTKSLIDGDFNFKPNISGIRMDVREDSSNNYSIVFSVVYKNKSSKYIGFASFDENFDLTPDPKRIYLLGGGASSRPCPTHCPEE